MRKVSEGTTLPDELDNVPNGVMPSHLLAPFLGKWRMYHRSVPLFERFFAAAKAELGIDLSVIPGVTSIYRPIERQETLFYARHYETPTGTKLYKGKRYSLRPGMAQAATPGFSLHGWALAADICYLNGRAITSTDRVRLRPVAARFGIKDTVSSENWHWCAVDVDRYYPMFVEAQPPSGIQNPPEPPRLGTDLMRGDPGIYPRLPIEAFRDLPVLQVGSSGDVVTYVRMTLVLVGNQPDCPLAGDYDQDLWWRVARFQEGWRVFVDPNMQVDGIVKEADYLAFAVAWIFSGKLPA